MLYAWVLVICEMQWPRSVRKNSPVMPEMTHGTNMLCKIIICMTPVEKKSFISYKRTHTNTTAHTFNMMMMNTVVKCIFTLEKTLITWAAGTSSCVITVFIYETHWIFYSLSTVARKRPWKTLTIYIRVKNQEAQPKEMLKSSGTVHLSRFNFKWAMFANVGS